MADEEIPHYLDTTVASQVHKERNITRFSNVLETKEKTKITTRNVNTASIKFKSASRNAIMKAEDRIANEEVLRSMNHKMNYLRNPHNNPRAVTRTITNPNMQAKATSKTLKYTSKPIAEESESFPLFSSSPSKVIFSSYEIDQTSTMTLSFRNISTITRNFKVIPPANSNIFTMSELKYPPNSKAGFIAPGMSATTIVSFTPKSLGDYNDRIIVSTENGKLEIPVLAHRESPILSLPSVLDIGTCLVGDAKRISISCSNSGGPAAMTITRLESDSYQQFGSTDCLRIPPFTIFPVEFTLSKNQSVDLFFDFVPMTIDKFSQQYVIKFDNNTSKVFTVIGISEQINLSVTDVNDKPINTEFENSHRDIYFSPVDIHSEESQTMTIVNDTNIPLQYEWVLIMPPPRTTPDVVLTMAQHKVDENKRNFELALSKLSNRNTISDSFDNEQVMNPLLSDSDDLVQRNSIQEYGFELSPARGVLSGEGLETVTITFRPTTQDLIDVQAVLVIKDVTHASMPNFSQKMHLESLLNSGHGAYPRLCSWLEELSIINNVDPYINQSTGAYKTQSHIVNLASIFDIVSKYFVKGDDSSDMNDDLKDFYRRTEMLMDHVNKWQQRALEVYDEDEDTSSLNKSDSHGQYFPEEIIVTTIPVNDEDWNDDIDMPSVDLNAHASTTSEVHSLSLVMPEDDVYIYSFYHDESTNQHSPITAQAVYPLRIKFNDDYNVTEDKPPNIEKNDALAVQVNAYDKNMISSLIWLDSSNAILLLGTSLSKYLDSLVSHEAVDYIRENSLTNVACLSTRIIGQGKPNHVHLNIPHITLPGGHAINQPWETSFTIYNPSSTAVDINLYNGELCAIESSFTPDPNIESSSFVAKVECFPERLVVMPNSDAIVNLVVYGKQIGRHRVVLPITTNQRYAVTSNLTIDINVIPTKLRFDVSEVDVGLISVGQSQQVEVSFSNEGNIPVRYMFSSNIDVDFETMSVLLSSRPSKNTSRSKSNLMTSRSQLSSRSQSISQYLTHRSGETSISDSGMTSDRSYAIDNPTAVVSFDPVNDTLQPAGTSSVTITCKAGRVPQHVRGNIFCHVYDSTGSLLLHHHIIDLRGEIQAPKVSISPLSNDLHDIYVGVPVLFKITLQNLCNLTTKFKLDYPTGIPTSYSLRFNMEKGILGSREVVVLEGEIIANKVCMIDDVFGLKIFGVAKPLGFTVKAIARSVQYELYQLQPDELPPQPLCLSTSTQYLPLRALTSSLVDKAIEYVPPPEPISVKLLSFPDDGVPLYERSSISVVIRNISACKMPYSIILEKYGYSTATEKDKIQAMDDFVSQLACDENEENSSMILRRIEAQSTSAAFQSAQGKKLIHQKTLRSQEKKYLTRGQGVALVITPSSEGVLEPWGVTTLTIHACNDSPGKYKDLFVMKYIDAGEEKIMSIPLLLSVQGCPLVIDRNTIGMSYVRHKTRLLNMIGTPLLRMGQGIVNSSPLERILVIRNNGANTGYVSWTIRNIASSDVEGDIAKIEPESASISGYGSVVFRATFVRHDIPGSVRLRADARVSFDKEAWKQGAPSDTDYSLTCVIEGEYTHPILSVNKKTYVIDQHDKLACSLVEDNDVSDGSIKMSVQAPELFRKAKDKVDCSRIVTFTNPLDTAVDVDVSVDGPFILPSSSSKPKKSLSLSLGPHLSHELSIQYRPNKAIESTLNATAHSSSATADNTTSSVLEDGLLRMAYRSGQSLLIPIRTTIATPFIVGSSAKLVFGVCHVLKNCSGMMLLSNGTNVRAYWTVSEVPDGGLCRRFTEIAVSGYEDIGGEVDDPSVFDISPTSGELEGPCVSVTAAMSAPPNDPLRSADPIVPTRALGTSWARENQSLTLEDTIRVRHDTQRQFMSDALYPTPIHITFKPKKNVKYSSRFRFACEYGNVFDVILKGRGTYEEHEHNPLSPMPK